MKWPKNAISMQAFRAPMYLQTMRNYQDAHLVDPDALGKDSTINISGKQLTNLAQLQRHKDLNLIRNLNVSNNNLSSFKGLPRKMDHLTVLLLSENPFNLYSEHSITHFYPSLAYVEFYGFISKNNPSSFSGTYINSIALFRKLITGEEAYLHGLQLKGQNLRFKIRNFAKTPVKSQQNKYQFSIQAYKLTDQPMQQKKILVKIFRILTGFSITLLVQMQQCLSDVRKPFDVEFVGQVDAGCRAPIHYVEQQMSCKQNYLVILIKVENETCCALYKEKELLKASFAEEEALLQQKIEAFYRESHGGVIEHPTRAQSGSQYSANTQNTRSPLDTSSIFKYIESASSTQIETFCLDKSAILSQSGCAHNSFPSAETHRPITINATLRLRFTLQHVGNELVALPFVQDTIYQFVVNRSNLVQATTSNILIVANQHGVYSCSIHYDGVDYETNDVLVRERVITTLTEEAQNRQTVMLMQTLTSPSPAEATPRSLITASSPAPAQCTARRGRRRRKANKKGMGNQRNDRTEQGPTRPMSSLRTKALTFNLHAAPSIDFHEYGSILADSGHIDSMVPAPTTAAPELISYRVTSCSDTVIHLHMQLLAAQQVPPVVALFNGFRDGSYSPSAATVRVEQDSTNMSVFTIIIGTTDLDSGSLLYMRVTLDNGVVLFKQVTASPVGVFLRINEPVSCKCFAATPSGLSKSHIFVGEGEIQVGKKGADIFGPSAISNTTMFGVNEHNVGAAKLPHVPTGALNYYTAQTFLENAILHQAGRRFFQEEGEYDGSNTYGYYQGDLRKNLEKQFGKGKFNSLVLAEGGHAGIVFTASQKDYALLLLAYRKARGMLYKPEYVDKQLMAYYETVSANSDKHPASAPNDAIAMFNRWQEELQRAPPWNFEPIAGHNVKISDLKRKTAFITLQQEQDREYVTSVVVLEPGDNALTIGGDKTGQELRAANELYTLPIGVIQ